MRNMVELDEIRSLHDYSGMLYAGTVLTWADQTEHDPESVAPEEFEIYLSWAKQEQIPFRVNSKEDFKTVLRYIKDSDWENDEAYDLFLQVRDNNR